MEERFSSILMVQFYKGTKIRVALRSSSVTSGVSQKHPLDQTQRHSRTSHSAHTFWYKMKLFTVAVLLFIMIHLDSTPSVNGRILSKDEKCYIDYLSLVGNKKNEKKDIYFCNGKYECAI